MRFLICDLIFDCILLQGSIVGPLLFLLYINAIVKNIGSNIRLFANDFLLDWILYVPSAIFQLCRDGSSWVEPVLS